MKDVIEQLNKRSLAEATGISYSKLRKFASGAVAELTEKEKTLIYEYLIKIAGVFKNT